MKPFVITKRLTNRESLSFQQYLHDVSQIAIFTPEEEVECSLKASQGDRKAIDELVTRNLRFVISVAKQYATPLNPLEDLVNEGNYGLIKAAEKFDPTTGFRFISYAVWWVRKKILEHLNNNGRLVRFPLNKVNGLSSLDKQITLMEQRLGRNVDIQEIIAEFDLDQKSAGILSSLSTYHMDSLDREIGGEDGGGSTTLGDMLSDNSTFKEPDSGLFIDDIKIEISRILTLLKPRDKNIMISLYGLDGNIPKSLKEVGDEIGVTREMIRQIREKSLKKLKCNLQNSKIRFA